MKIVPTSLSVVLIGKWNPYIFQPDWVQKYLCSSPQAAEVKIAFALNDRSLPPQIEFEGVRVYPGESRFEIKPLEPDEENLQRSIEASIKTIKTLSHTPITAVGINVSVEETDEPLDFLSQIAAFNDIARINSEKYVLLDTTIRRGFKIQAGGILNLSANLTKDHATLDFNLHFDTGDATNALAVLDRTNAGFVFGVVKEFVEGTYAREIELEPHK
jgi:hypothetical protein